MHSSHLGRSFHFAAGETIYTGQSQKYTSAIVQALAVGSGFGPAGLRLDEAGWDGLAFWQVAGKRNYSSNMEPLHGKATWQNLEELLALMAVPEGTHHSNALPSFVDTP